MTNTCRCDRPTRDDAFVCDTCADSLARALGEIPWLEDELETTITRRQGIDYRRIGGGKGGKKAGEMPAPANLGASEARTHLKALLVSWALFAHQEEVRNSAPCTCDNEARPQGAVTPGGLSPAHLTQPERG